ncbi:MAG TPA: ATP-binding protein [Patescibacteria group bacterium]|nr:ATP-binding protein [Patescibacteria group bacterium]
MDSKTDPDSNDSLKAKIAALSEFGHAVVHDLKAPLRHIVTYTGMLEGIYVDKLDENGRKFLSRLSVNAARAQQLIDRLLQYAEAEESKGPSEDADLEAVAATAITGLEEVIHEAGARVTVGALPHIRTRREDVLMVLDILIENALTYRGAASPEINLTSEDLGEKIEISVADNGPGVSEEYREMIFQPFKRLHSRDEIEGTGLGLAIARRLVERNGGRIGMRQNAPVGAIFYFTLPKNP